MVNYDSYYDLLDVQKDASQAEIKAAYREKVKTYHPDVSDHDNAEELFKALTDAKETLTTPNERNHYDRVGHNAYTTGHSPSTNSEPSPSSSNSTQPSSNSSQTQSTTRNTTHDRTTTSPDPDDWVGTPGWSSPPSETQSTTHDPTGTRATSTTKSTQWTPPSSSNDWEQSPSFVIPNQYLQSAFLLTGLLYGFCIYGIFIPAATPTHALVGTVLFPFTFLFLTSTRLGFYIFPVFAISTPLILIATTTFDISSIHLLTATLLPVFGVFLTLLVSSIRPN